MLGVLAVIWLVAGAGTVLHAPKPVQPASSEGGLRVLTYNIQQGYSADGLRNLDGQLDLIRQVDADLVGLQETDTNRISGSHDDLVRYFADRLNLYSYYGPSPVSGTFGIALLSKYPLIDPRTYYLYSTGEQTAIISAQVQVGGQNYHIYVTHLGNGGPVIQQEGVLQLVHGLDKVILVGDFNFRPDSESYRLTTPQLVDSWLKKWPAGDPEQGVDPADRIDHIFLSPDLIVAEARFLAEPDSDHPALYADIER
jgi:endonuclease/exonuclease/phosphatase family metal-dependent hydrolase